MAALNKTPGIAFRLKTYCFHRSVVTSASRLTSTPKIVENGIQIDGETICPSPRYKSQLDLFSSYKAKIVSARIPRVEKIEVNFIHSGIGHGATMIMNKGLSTPYNCAQHVSKNHVRDSAIALVKKSASMTQELTVLDNSKPDGSLVELQDFDETILDAAWIPWDMHRPLEYDCDLKFLKFNMELSTPAEMAVLNTAYWKTCALILGAIAKQAFKDDAMVKLVHLPKIDIKSGAFCYDIELSDDIINNENKIKWNNDEQSLVQLTKVARHVIGQNHIFERLEIPREDAAAIFAGDDRILKRLQKNYTTVSKDSCVPIYKFGNFLDIIDGPLLPSTSFLFHYVVTAVHQLGSINAGSCLWRFQGLSLPKSLQVHHAIWAMLERRAKRLVKEDMPVDVFDHEELDVPMHKYRSIENKTKKYSFATGQWLEDSWSESKDMNS